VWWYWKKPSDVERGQQYFQRCVQHLPTAGEIVLSARSWYNRAGVERVMGFCSDEEYQEFMRQTPQFERQRVAAACISSNSGSQSADKNSGGVSRSARHIPSSSGS
jgi:polyphosphate kinase 2 (PPK2 family)